MRLSLLAASTLALFVSTSFANSPIATVIIQTPDAESAHFAQSSECVPVDPDVRDTPIRHIIIAPYRPGTGIECTFYKDPFCRSGPSHSYTLHEGRHTFKRPFLVSGFECVESDGEDAFL